MISAAIALVDGVLGQVEQVRAALGDESIDVSGVLCFIEADWPLIGAFFSTRDVRVLSPRRLSKILDEASGGVDVASVPRQDRSSASARVTLEWFRGSSLALLAPQPAVPGMVGTARERDSLVPRRSPGNRKEALERASDLHVYCGRYWV